MITVELGNASEWKGHADFIFTHPYADIPRQLHGTPAVLNLFEGKVRRRWQAAQWMGRDTLWHLSWWGKGLHNHLYVCNLPVREIDCRMLIEDDGGWFPLDMVRRVMDLYQDFLPPGSVVWDGFCGRGSVGAVCAERGLSYVGIDKNPERVQMTREFLGLQK